MLDVLIPALVPLYILVGLGYIAGRWLDVNLRSLAAMVIYIISPVVTFGAILQLEFAASYILLPAILFLVGCFIAYVASKTSHRYFRDNRSNLIGMASSMANTGYFGLPVVIALFGSESTGIYMLLILGVTISEVTVGFYIGARGNFTVKQSIIKLLKLPPLHGAILAILCNTLNITMPDTFYTYWHYFTGCYVVIGMAVLGIALSKIKKFRFNLPLNVWLFGFRFIVWPVLLGLVILFDTTVTQLFSPDIHIQIFLIGLVPMAVNTVAYAEILNVRPGEIAVPVLLSTLFSLFYIPAAFWLLGL